MPMGIFQDQEPGASPVFEPSPARLLVASGDSVAMGLEALVEALCPGPRASMWIEVSVPVRSGVGITTQVG